MSLSLMVNDIPTDFILSLKYTTSNSSLLVFSLYSWKAWSNSTLSSSSTIVTLTLDITDGLDFAANTAILVASLKSSCIVEAAKSMSM